jgi:hypothetical protein
MADNKQNEKKAPVDPKDPKRNVQTIELEHLEDVVGGFDDAGFGPNLRMATEN